MCTNALPGSRIRELCRTTLTHGVRVVWMSCAGVRNSNTAATLTLKGRVDFTCFSQTHFASAVGHESVDPNVDAFFHGEVFHVNSS